MFEIDLIDSNLTRVLLSVIAILLYLIYSFIKSKKYIPRLIKVVALISYYFTKPQKHNTITIKDVMNKRHITVSVLDEMIGYFESSHIGIFVFHNGTIALNGIHLFKISMIDERSRYYSVIMENQNLPASLFIDLIEDVKINGYVEIDKQTTSITWLKEALNALPLINYMYYAIQFIDNVPEYVISIGTYSRLSKSKIDKFVNYYKPTLNQIYSNRLENNLYENLKRNEI
jgi:hypothetical protein